MSRYLPLLPAETLPVHAVGADSPLQLKARGEEVRWLFTSLADAPDWIDRNWVGVDGIAQVLAVPASFSETATNQKLLVRKGDTLVYTPPRAGSGDPYGRFRVIAGDPPPPKPIEPQASAASLEDQLATRMLSVSDLTEDARRQLGERLSYRMGVRAAENYLARLEQRPMKA